MTKRKTIKRIKIKKDKKDKNKKNNKVQTPGKDVDKESKYESDLSGGTSKVDSSTGLKDGSYVPDKFSWSGGTGKVQISCSKVSITGGQAYATITFSSDAYGYVKANGNMYYPDHSGGGSTFVIPVALNKNNSIIGMTTRMSVPHEIQYSIFVYLNGADNKQRQRQRKSILLLTVWFPPAIKSWTTKLRRSPVLSTRMKLLWNMQST